MHVKSPESYSKTCTIRPGTPLHHIALPPSHLEYYHKKAHASSKDTIKAYLALNEQESLSRPKVALKPPNP